MYSFRLLFCLILVVCLNGIYATKSKGQQVPSVWATIIDYYPQDKEFRDKVLEANGNSIKSDFIGFFDYWQKRNKDSLDTVRDNFLGYVYRQREGSYELVTSYGFQKPNLDTIEKVLLLIQHQGKKAELFSVLGDLLTINKQPELAIRAYERAILLGHPQSNRLRKLQKTVFRQAGYKNLTSQNIDFAVMNVKLTLKRELAVIKKWQKNPEKFVGTPPLWTKNIRIWKVPSKKSKVKERQMNKNKLIGAIVLSSISLIVALLLSQTFEKRFRGPQTSE